MKHGSLFTGIGGFDLAASWMGWQNCFQVENDPFCLTILEHQFPEVPKYSDILTFNASDHGHSVDIISGGFPCQPFSVAGQRKGTEDHRYLWPAMHAAICKIRPRWVLAENVHGLLNWNRGLVFEQVCADLEAAGYQVQPVIIPAAGLNAPHVRKRIFFIAHATDPGYGPAPASTPTQTSRKTAGRKKLFRTPFEDGYAGHATHTNRKRLQRLRVPAGTNPQGRPYKGRHVAQPARPDWSKWPTESPVCSRTDGISNELDTITFSAWRQKSIHALGNAIVPQVAYQIFLAIHHWESSAASKMPPTP